MSGILRGLGGVRVKYFDKVCVDFYEGDWRFYIL